MFKQIYEMAMLAATMDMSSIYQPPKKQKSTRSILNNKQKANRKKKNKQQKASRRGNR